MAIPFMDLSLIHEPIKERIVSKVSDIMSKGDFILGEEVTEFERSFAKYCGSKYCISVASGSDALNLCVNALELSGEEIITVSNTFVATVDCIIRNNAKAHFVDIDNSTLQLDPDKLKELVTKNTKAIIPVDLYGSMPDWGQLREIANKYDLLIIEDACQAHGSKYKGTSAGRFGKVGCFSFYPGKNLGAFGDGGAIITDDEELRDRLIKLRNYGQSKKYYHDTVGFNSRLDTIQAAILRIKLEYLDEWTENKRKAGRMYIEELSKERSIRIPSINDEVYHSYHLFPILLHRRNEAQQYLHKQGISTGIHYPIPIHKQNGYQDLCHFSDLRNTESAASTILSLPMFPGISQEQVLAVCKALHEFASDS